MKCVNDMNSDLKHVNEWCDRWLVSLNAKKCIAMLFTSKCPHCMLLPIKLGTATLKQVFSYKHLGLTLTPNLSWNEHISNIIAKANKRLLIMNYFKYRISRKTLSIGYMSFVRPILEYGDIIFDSCPKYLIAISWRMYNWLQQEL